MNERRRKKSVNSAQAFRFIIARETERKHNFNHTSTNMKIVCIVNNYDEIAILLNATIFNATSNYHIRVNKESFDGFRLTSI